MKHIKILVAIPLVLTLCAFDSCSKDDSQSDADAKKAAQQKAAHDAFIGEAPKEGPAYNIMDYAKPVSPSNAQNSAAPNSNSPPKQ